MSNTDYSEYYTKFQKHFNELPSCRKCRRLNETRKNTLRRRISSDPEWWAILFQAFEHIHYLYNEGKARGLFGENDRGWKMSPEWVLRPLTADRILEGVYDKWKSPSEQANDATYVTLEDNDG